MQKNKVLAGTGFNALAAMLLIMGLLVTVAPARAAGVTTNPCEGTGSTVIVLDAGHGGADTGAVNTTYQLNESDITLDLAIRTRNLLTAANPAYKVCFTRYNSTDNPTNTQRAELANGYGGKVLVLIHLNGASNPNTDYTQTFWGKKIKTWNFPRPSIIPSGTAANCLPWPMTRPTISFPGSRGTG